ncbi:hypothetical protein LOAG_09475 [Loa loa]|uniref:Uncharacterized protein n=1 Tax=Loa loa TaxID=7209 RepID=A0A1S0TRL6_LOALO|nr:hypothetical protein LOAG_09475 [Loa loa]EFO19021.1 hypothetical protein LOAG_09475 [Loa loa]
MGSFYLANIFKIERNLKANTWKEERKKLAVAYLNNEDNIRSNRDECRMMV